MSKKIKIYGVYKVGYSPSEYTRLVHEPALEYFDRKEDALKYAKEMRPQLEREDDLGKLKLEVSALEVTEEYMPSIGTVLRFEDGGYIRKDDLSQA